MTHSESEIFPGSLRERDLDFLLFEEFVSNPDFVAWFAKQVLPSRVSINPVPKRVCRSHIDITGESDVEVTLETGDSSEVIMLLLENKITAGFQPDQAHRYQQRGETYKCSGEADDFVAVLCCPLAYCGDASSSKGFTVVTYEAIQTWLKSELAPGPRRRYKCLVLQRAIDKARLGYDPEDDELVTQFWQDYWDLMASRYPEFNMAKPGAKPGNSDWAVFHPADLGKDLMLRHKMAMGRVDLEIKGRGKQVSRLHAGLKDFLEPDMCVEQAAKSAAVRIATPCLDKRRPLKDQLENVRNGQDAAMRLYRWYIANKQVLEAVLRSA